jgi:hypothetical protein
MFCDDKLQEAYERLQKSINRTEQLTKLGAESAAQRLRLSSPIKTRSTAARIARVAGLEAKFDLIVEDIEHENFAESQAKRRKAPNATILTSCLSEHSPCQTSNGTSNTSTTLSLSQQISQDK